MAEIGAIIDEYDILAVMETWLYPEFALSFKGYKIVKRDALDSTNRGTRRGTAEGGLCLIIKEQIKFQEKTINDDTNMETLAVSIESEEGNTDLILIYRSPSKNTTQTQWNNLLDNLEKNERMIIMGDMNAKNMMWNCAEDDTQGLRLANILEERDLFVVNGHTLSRPASGSYRASNIDLLITKFEMLQRIDASNSGLTLGSDHQIIDIQTDMTVPPGGMSKRFSTRKYGYKKINWNMYKMRMDVASGNLARSGPEVMSETEEEAEIRKAIYKGLKEAGATKPKQIRNNHGRPKENGKRKNKRRWWDEDCDRVREEKKRALNTFNRRRNEET
uniref:uncharacterized protein LOC117605352 n=1 Tax=Osmia lignaria TaxID=473952 RepID=UPI00147854BA|nr:uncharacterized protein LOC117605352 [Osmia lignaria]